jgi:NAD+ synthase (glutamine-hydrolysing)
MTEAFRGNAEQIKANLALEGIKYGISIGRRAPMHRMHADCIKEITNAGLTPVIFIGSTNGPQSPHYNPLRNPLTVAQQKSQIKVVFPELDIEKHVITLDDVGDYTKWCDSLSATLARTGLAGKSVAHFRSKFADAGASGAIKPLSAYTQGFVDRGLPVWESFNHDKADDAINASELRTLDLENLTAAKRQLFAAPDYIIHIAKEARAHNASKAELEAHHIPVTMLDLTFDRLQKEAGIETAPLIKAAEAQGEVTLASLTQATEAAIKQLHTHAQPKAVKQGVQLKVASASLNQTVQNFTRNVPNILAAIDQAVADKADILSLQELVLTGYTGDDNFKWIRSDQQQKELIELLQYIADYAKERDPNLVLSVGFPFFYADKKEPLKLNVGTEEKPALVDNPLYNINNKPFNAVAIISGGKIQAISAKSIQPEGAAEYEPRQFLSWPDYLGVKDVTLYNGEKVPFGKVIVQLGKDNGKSATVYHEICAEAWPGLADDGTVNLKEQREGRHLCHLVKKHDISLVINPSASKPEPFLDKPELRKKLCISGSEITHGGGYVYTNVTGLEAAPIAFEGGSIFANKGQIAHTGERYSMADVVYSSTPMHLPAPEKGAPHVVIPHEFRHHDEQKKGGSAKWEQQKGDVRVYEELMRNTGLWLRDYLKKSGQQGFFISLSGGQDSAFGAVAIIQMIDLNINQLEQSLGSKEKAVAAFVDQFDGLKYAADVKKVTQEQGAESGIEFLKSKMLSCAYFPSENSSKATENAARTLIEGGTLPDGTKVKGIGGTFHIMPVQDIVDSYLEVFSGVDKTGLSPEQKDRLRTEIKQCIKGERETVSDEFKDTIKRRILSWKNKGDDLTLQNVQARVRLPVAWLFGNDENKIACVTSNWSEAVAGYWTFGGDGHMGSINVLGGIPKSDVRRVLKHLETVGLDGHEPIPSLHYINQNKASAELRPLSKDGKIIQFDEDDMMPYEALDAIARKIIIGKNSPVEAYKQLWQEQSKFDNGKPIFDSKERLIADIEQCCWRWHSSQFKRVAAVITPFLGQNVDPHTAVRTTIMSDGFMTGRAALKMEYLKDKLGGEEAFEKALGKPFNKMLIELKISGSLRQAVLKSPLDKLEDAVKNQISAGVSPRGAYGG